MCGLRRAIAGLWTLLPALLIAGLWLARRRYPQQLSDIGWLLVLLGLLQMLALVAAFAARRQPVLPAVTAVLALWATYIAAVEPLERSLYDTRTFSREVQARIRQQPAPLVLHGLGKDAKAIKLIVHLDSDRVPLFTRQPADLAAVQGPAWLVMSEEDFDGLTDPRWRSMTPTFSGQFDKNAYVLLYLVKTPQP